MPSSIFKKYDIRGAYPLELNQASSQRIAAAYFQIINPERVCIAYDPIEGSEVVCSALTQELCRLGVNVVNLGVCSTPKLYFGSNYLKIAHALMCTSSHLGEGFTGIKFLKYGVPLEEFELAKIKTCYEQSSKELPKDFSLTQSGSVTNVSVDEPYTEAIRAFIAKGLSTYKVVFDASNGPVALFIDPVFRDTGLTYTVINSEVKAKELSHPSNPKLVEDRVQLAESVRTSHADLGVIWDGDGDRAFFIDSTGKLIPPEFIAVKIADYVKKTHGCRKITVDVRASSAMEELCAKVGIEVKRIQAWHVPIKLAMVQDPKIGFGCETSGHYVFRDFHRIDDGLLATVMFLDALNTQQQSLDEELKQFRATYYIPEEVNFTTSQSESVLAEKFVAQYASGQLDFTDGLTVTFPSWRFNIRSSKTEPIIRLNISGTSKADVQENLKLIESIVCA
jgi:phosphomannomutase